MLVRDNGVMIGKRWSKCTRFAKSELGSGEGQHVVFIKSGRGFLREA